MLAMSDEVMGQAIDSFLT
jgi:hypothetical protein